MGIKKLVCSSLILHSNTNNTLSSTFDKLTIKYKYKSLSCVVDCFFISLSDPKSERKSEYAWTSRAHKYTAPPHHYTPPHPFRAWHTHIRIPCDLPSEFECIILFGKSCLFHASRRMCFRPQDFKPRIHISPTDFLVITENGTLCDAGGQLGPADFEVLESRCFI